ncbi:hypothetical protein [Hungatella effluvii]|uniref:hypothetical protein n=1 Tax=Hungatella effluvii TaxID=1096246 RepID=UPI002A840DE0|nr:hypothetical protein [Hungatella effluvii]
MKKLILLMSISLIILSGCSSKRSIGSSPHLAESITTTYADNRIEEETLKFDALLYYDQLTKPLSDALTEANISDYEVIGYDNYEKRSDGDINIDLMLKTNICKLKTSCTYMSLISKWSIISIKNYDNGHYYYVTPGGAGTVDIYSYPDDLLVTPQSTRNPPEDIVEHFNNELESISESFDSALNDITENYYNN